MLLKERKKRVLRCKVGAKTGKSQPTHKQKPLAHDSHP